MVYVPLLFPIDQDYFNVMRTRRGEMVMTQAALEDQRLIMY